MRWLVLCLILLTACKTDNAPQQPDSAASTPPPAAEVKLSTFGYAAVMCDLDDPFDDTDKTDYSDEVANFTNANLVCLNDNIEQWPARLKTANAHFTPVLYAEPIFFSFDLNGGEILAGYETLWTAVKNAIEAAGIKDGEIIFYLADEPALRKLPPDALSIAAKTLKRDFPASKILLVEAYDAAGLPVIPAEIDLWAFNAYTIRNPGQDSRYVNYLNLAKSRLSSHQNLALIMDGIHTPIHAAAGLSETDMAEVAQNYLDLAKDRGDIAAIFVYSWAGGIDNDAEKGVRDLPSNVQEKHRDIGRFITGK